jgi:hypothetical protein
MTIFQQTLVKHKSRDDIDLRVVVATGLTIGAFAMLEKLNQPLVVGLAWVALVTKVFVPLEFQFGPGKQDKVSYKPFAQSMSENWNVKD